LWEGQRSETILLGVGTGDSGAGQFRRRTRQPVALTPVYSSTGKKASEDKLLRERYLIASELVFLLKQFAEGCARVVADAGHTDPQIERLPTEGYPILTLGEVTGDWRALNAKIMYCVREIPVMQTEARRTIAGVSEHDHPIYATSYFRERHYQYDRPGMKALILAMRLRRSVGLPESR